MRLKVKAIQALEPEYGLSVMLSVAGMARSTYYYQCSIMNRPNKHEDIVRTMRKLHRIHKGRYGYRRMAAALKDEQYVVNHKTVRKLMVSNGLICKVRRKKKKYKPSPELAAVPNILNREFNADAPFQKGVTDVTEFDVGRNRVYVSAIQDLFDGAVISMSYSIYNNTELIMSMYQQMSPKIQKRLNNMLIHSDQGSLYRTIRYRDFISSKNITQSMSRKGNCYDNAVIESFFGTFKCETLRLYPIHTIEQLKQELQEYANYYNQKRLKSTLGYKSPFQYRKDKGFGNFTYLCSLNNAFGADYTNQLS